MRSSHCTTTASSSKSPSYPRVNRYKITYPDCYRKISVPTESAPYDVLSLIFLAYVGVDRGVDDTRLLAAVSRRWRAICLSFPRLWSQIYIYLFDSPADDLGGYHKHLAKAKFNFLPSHSGKCSLHINDNTSVGTMRYVRAPYTN